ncbi:amidohydrolase [Gallicola sp. Sow4_E12]|uniref:amidohydrolase n=1 Tax=Gallicola sp. Sow4_E12 TaxID=3438785 RepID=UPI003F90705D
MSYKTLIRNADIIVTCDNDDNLYYDSDILIENEKITKINFKADEAVKEDVDKIIEGKGKLIFPGLVNTHHHFFQTFARSLEQIDYTGMTVIEWLDKIYPIFEKIDDEVIYYSTMTALTDLIKHGCTTAYDLQYCYTKNSSKELVDLQMDAAKELGIRYHAGRGTNTLPKEKGSTIPFGMLETTDEFIHDCERLIGKYHDSSDYSMSQIVISPCQPVNSYKETFEESIKLARKHNTIMHTHLGEGENAIMEARYGKRTLEWCYDIGFTGEDVFYAHGWELTKEEFTLMAKDNIGLSHCPAPAILGGFPIINMVEMIESGLCISLGCDGSATNDSSNLLDTMRLAYMLQAFYNKERRGGVSPKEILRMATVNGAKTLGRKKLGSLEVDNGADLFMIDIDKLECVGAQHDPYSLIPRTGAVGEVNLTMINGKIVFQDGQLLGIDEKDFVNKGKKAWKSFMRRI